MLPQPREASPYAEIGDILPKLAINVGWLKLMGEARIEQKRRQLRKELPVSPEGTAYKARQLNARKIAKSKRRGMFGLLRAIAAA